MQKEVSDNFCKIKFLREIFGINGTACWFDFTVLAPHFFKLDRQKELSNKSFLNDFGKRKQLHFLKLVIFNVHFLSRLSFCIDCRNKETTWCTETSINKYVGCQSSLFFVCSSFPFFITVAIYHWIFEWCFYWLEVSHGILGFHCIASWHKDCIAIKVTALKISVWLHSKI